ncbi:MAG: hypothetical protein QOJ35_41 [Solirubrobacteraceae bacterium]|nr:hypothetical protein [Solirubrobacteraceae bacterium]
MLVVSFVALAALWQRPKLEHAGARELPRVPRWVDVVAGAAGVAVFCVVLYAGVAGIQSAPSSNLEPTVVYVAFWVGLVPLSALLGNVFAALSPWLAIARTAAWAGRRLGISHAPRPYPQAWGHWPAAAGITVFAWIELVLVRRDDPRLLAGLALVYAAVALAGMYRYGIRPWTAHADPFAVYFALFAAMAPLVRRDDRLLVCAPLAGLTELEVGPGSVALLCAIIGSTTFDGLTNGQVWSLLEPRLADAFAAVRRRRHRVRRAGGRDRARVLDRARVADLPLRRPRHVAAQGGRRPGAVAALRAHARADRVRPTRWRTTSRC